MVASLLQTLHGHSMDVTCVSFGKEELVTCSGDKTVRVWNIQDFSELPCSPLLAHTYIVNCCTFNKSGTVFATCSTDGKVILYDSKTGDQIAIFEHPSKSAVRVCRFSPNFTLIASGGDDNALCLWDIEKKKLVRTLQGHDESVMALAFTPDNNYIVSGSCNGDLRTWDASFGHGRCLSFELDGHDLGVTCCEFSPSFGTAGTPSVSAASFLLASGGKDDCIKIWHFMAEVGSPTVLLKLRDTLPGHNDSILSCCFSPDGSLLASGSIDKTIRLWDPLKGEGLFTIEGHSRYVTSCAFSRDGLMLASGSNDKTVMVWKLTNTTYIMNGLKGYEEPEASTSNIQSVTTDNDILSWSVDDVCDWISSLGLEDYKDMFKAQAIDGAELLALNTNDLQSALGIAPLGHRNKILRSRSKLESSPLKHKHDKCDKDVPDEYLCPITREIMVEPVIASDGYTYDKSAIKAWMETKDRSPMTNSLLIQKSLIPNRTLKMLIQKYQQTHR
ncbi:hypothetical protein LOTGIDRAFT_156843 [Lottia gigantea]|uniref:WD repeat, SAM and U-box domain-containing protein 1 n=1 Tax=Lottia gigantea TaxID=225164 RepID=V4CKW6_LOTGI|nr:hypothetical protein LOTGIDRAFT_156843 [Lottia gigantea]ESP02890.1 hypothetical protein LOTGIDRAFT_156843 [Lottia gigantea]